jgi:preprotein translocase subunit SecB
MYDNDIDYQIANIRLLKCELLPNPDYIPQQDTALKRENEITLSINNSGEFNDSGDMAHFNQEFRIESTSCLPFTLEVVYGADFVTSAPIPKDEQSDYIKSNFPQELFPFMREYVSNITFRAGFPPIVLHMDYRTQRGRSRPGD